MSKDLTVPILLYHKIADPPRGARVRGQYVSPGLFRRHLAFLASEGYSSLPLLALADRSRPLPARPIVITFDDGYRCLHQHALPALREHGFTATVFLVVEGIGSANTWETAAGDVEEPMLGLAEVREMQTEGIEFGSHTLAHPHLTALSPGQAETEIGQSRLRLEELLGASCRSFAYPYGDWNPHVRSLVADAGYLVACTTRRAAARPDDDLLALPRINIRRYNVLPRFRYKLWRARRAS
jgi:peptidoglycan/xylan/chitin deacetylase (PgdA/CDA1 family)